MVTLIVVGSLIGYTLVAGVVNEALPDRWPNHWHDKDYPHRTFMAVLWPLIGFWLPFKALSLVFNAPRRLLEARRDRKRLPEARVLP